MMRPEIPGHIVGTNRWRGRAGLIAALTFVPLTALAQPVPDADTLLLAQFDRSVDADYSIGSPAADTRATTTGAAGGRFGGGVDLALGEGIAYAGTDGNFHPQEGTIEFWVKPHWPGNDPNSHGFISCRMDERRYININTLPGGRLGIAIAAGEGDAWTWRRADADIAAWKPDTWHHVAFAWGKAQLHVYVDGEEGRRTATDAQMPTEAPEAITVTGADAVIDALRISKRMFSVEDARASIDEALHPPYLYLSDMQWTPSDAAMLDRRTLLGDVSIPLILGGVRYAKAVACLPGAEISTRLEQPFDALEAVVGVCSLSPPDASCSFEVWGDGKKLFGSEPRTGKQPPLPVRVDISGVKELVLSAKSGPASRRRGHAIWANAVARRNDTDEVLVTARPMKPALLDMYRRQQAADDYSFQLRAESPCVVAGKFWEDEMDPAREPAAEKIGRPLEAFATPGEYEPVNFVVYAVDDLDKLHVEVTDLRCGDSLLAASRIDVRLVLRRLMRDLYTLPPERSTVVSRFLLPYQDVDVPAGTFREYHLIVHVPDDAAPGKYTGHVRLTPSGREAIELPVVFEVLPFRLRPLEKRGYGVYYRFPAAEDDWSRVDVELADIRAHGSNMLKSNLGVEYEIVDGKVEPSLAALEHGLTVLRKHGFHGPLPVHTGCEHAARLLGYNPVEDYSDESARERFFGVVKRAMEAIVALSAEYPEFELLPTHMDEVFGRDRLQRYIRLTEAVRQVPSLRVYITLHNDPKRDVQEMMRQCDPYVDVRCYNGHCMDSWIRAGHTFDDLARQLDQSGDEAWLYHNIRGSFFPAEWTRLVNGYYMWTSPLKVHVPWMYYSFKGNPFDATDGPRLRGGDFAYAAPHPADPTEMVPTRHWEGFREGIDDMRYLATLEALIDEHPGTPQSDAARAWLANLRRGVTPTHAELEPIEEESPLLVWLAKKLDGADYRRIRRQAAEHIVRLVALGK